MASINISWDYLTVPIGEHWADEYINWAFLDELYTKGHKKFGGTRSNRWFPQEDDNGLGDLRFFRKGGDIRPLLSTSLKIEKSDGSAVFVRVLYLSPAAESMLPVEDVFPEDGYVDGSGNYAYGIPVPKTRANPNLKLNGKGANTCVAGDCEFVCITTSGNMSFQGRARYVKTWYFLTEPVIFLRQILSECAMYANDAFLSNMLFYARLNGTSDILWERLIHMDKFTDDVTGFGGWYDYTKHPFKTRVEAYVNETGKTWPDYYHLTYSVDERLNRGQLASDYLNYGFGVSVVTPEPNVKTILKEVKGDPKKSFVIDADITDFRFADPPRAVCLLKSKGALISADDDIKYSRQMQRMTEAQSACSLVLQRRQKREGASENLIRIAKLENLIGDGPLVTTYLDDETFPSEGVRGEEGGSFELTLNEIRTFIRAIEKMNEVNPLKGPRNKQKPFAIQKAKSMGIAEFPENALTVAIGGDAMYMRKAYDEYGENIAEKLKLQEARDKKAKAYQQAKEAAAINEAAAYVMAKESLDQMTIDQLKEQLERFGVDTKGTKAELQARLKKLVSKDRYAEIAQVSIGAFDRAVKKYKAQVEKGSKKKDKVSNPKARGSNKFTAPRMGWSASDAEFNGNPKRMSTDVFAVRERGKWYLVMVSDNRAIHIDGVQEWSSRDHLRYDLMEHGYDLDSSNRLIML